MRILTNTTKRGDPYWLKHVHVLPGWMEELNRTGGFPRPEWTWRHLLWGWRLWRQAARFDAVATGADKPSLVFMALQAIAPRRPHIVIHTNWNLPLQRWRARFRRWAVQFLMRGVSVLVVYSREQLERYHRHLGIARGRMTVIPYHTTIEPAPGTRGDYVFSGGDYTRDYRTLIRAVEDLPVRLIIAARLRHYFQGLTIPANVEIVTVTHEDFVRLMAGAAAVVVPLTPGLFHSGGQQTFLNAMVLGKPVVVADDCGAREYIEDGVDGMVIPPGDAEAMRAAIRRVLDCPGLAASLGEAGRRKAARFTAERFCDAVLEAARSARQGGRL